MATKEYKTFAFEETEELGMKIATKLQSGDIITLDGDLGAGKTVLTRGIVKGLNINARVCSPTYTIVNEYLGNDNSKVKAVFHFDTYRLSGSDDFLDSGLDEYFYRDGVCIIEWSSVIKDILDELKNRRIISIEIVGNGDMREIKIDSL